MLLHILSAATVANSSSNGDSVMIGATLVLCTATFALLLWKRDSQSHI